MLFKKLSIITALILLFETPVFACYGIGCSTSVGGVYNAGWSIYNQKFPAVVTNPISILDTPEKYINYSISANSNGNISQTFGTKKGNPRIKVKVKTRKK